MFCAKCGKENKDDAAFCAYCGPTPVNEETPVPKKTSRNKFWKCFGIGCGIVAARRVGSAHHSS